MPMPTLSKRERATILPSQQPRPKWKALPSYLIHIWAVYVYPISPGAYVRPYAYFTDEDSAYALADTLWQAQPNRRADIAVQHAAAVLLEGNYHLCHMNSITISKKSTPNPEKDSTPTPN